MGYLLQTQNLPASCFTGSTLNLAFIGSSVHFLGECPMLPMPIRGLNSRTQRQQLPILNFTYCHINGLLRLVISVTLLCKCFTLILHTSLNAEAIYNVYNKEVLKFYNPDLITSYVINSIVPELKSFDIESSKLSRLYLEQQLYMLVNITNANITL